MEKNEEEDSITFETTYSNNFGIQANAEPLKVVINHSFHEPTQEEIRQAEENRRRLAKKYTPQVLRMLELHTRPEDPQPFLSTDEIARLIKPDGERGFEDTIYSICDNLEKRNILDSRRFYDDQGEYTRIWWLSRRNRNAKG